MSSVVTCPPERRRELAETLTAAFADDPVLRWMITGPARARRLRFFFSLAVPRSAVELGGCDLADGGAAVWYPPGTFAAQPQNILRELPLALAAFGPRLARAAAVEAQIRRSHPVEPHWYLQFVGVRPERVGRGTGTALLEHRLAIIDADHGAAFLESSSERNLPLYERFGFVITEEVRLGPGAPPEWLMWRAPVP